MEINEINKIFKCDAPNCYETSSLNKNPLLPLKCGDFLCEKDVKI